MLRAHVLSITVAYACSAGERTAAEDPRDDERTDAGESDRGVAEPMLLGGVYLQRERDGAVDRLRVSAYFEAHEGSHGRCAREIDGPCITSHCEEPTNALPSYPSAGPINIDAGPIRVLLEPSDVGTYEVLDHEGPSWRAGDAIGVRADGAEVAAFDAELPSPEPVESTASRFASAIDRSTSVELQWEAGPSLVRTILSANLPTGAYLITSCSFAGETGSGTIPAEALLRLPAGTATFLVLSVRETKLRSGRWSVEIGAEVNAIDPAGHPLRGNVELE